MAKSTAPLLGFGASGQIGKSQVYSTWRGVKYARQHVIPANPRTDSQMATRNLFAVLSNMWKAAPAILISTWNAQAKGNKYTGRNHFMGRNTKALLGQSSFDALIGSPGNGGGLPLATISAANDDTDPQLVITFTAPALLVGWTATAINAIAVGQLADLTTYVGPMVSATGDPAGGTLEVDGLPHAQANVVSAWMTYTTPAGKTVYGPSTTVVAASNP